MRLPTLRGLAMIRARAHIELTCLTPLIPSCRDSAARSTAAGWAVSAASWPIPRPSRPWRPGRRRSPRAARASWSGCWSTRRSTPPGSRPRTARPAGPRPFPGVRDGPRRPVHLSRPRPARGLCDAGPDAARAGRARLRLRAGAWVIGTLAAFNVKGEGREGRVGVWVSGTRAGGRRARTRSPPSA